jgi:hypothetical protein
MADYRRVMGQPDPLRPMRAAIVAGALNTLMRDECPSNIDINSTGLCDGLINRRDVS